MSTNRRTYRVAQSNVIQVYVSPIPKENMILSNLCQLNEWAKSEGKRFLSKLVFFLLLFKSFVLRTRCTFR